MPEALPRKAPRPQRPLRRGAAFFVRRQDGAVLVRTRPAKGLLGGMVELPGTDWEMDFDANSAVQAGAGCSVLPETRSRAIAHAFTHFALRLEIYVAEVPNDERAPNGYRCGRMRDLDKEAFPGVMRKVLEAVRKSGAIVWVD